MKSVSKEKAVFRWEEHLEMTEGYIEGFMKAALR
jgi:hypothetical protein